MPGALSNFLMKNSIGTTGAMPVIHTTNAYAGKKIIQGDLIKPSRCDVFGEDLTYLFYGRPSYKKTGDAQIAHYWELPALFVMDYDKIAYKRIFPFDTGAFEGERYPSFINMMPLEEFEVTGALEAPTAGQCVLRRS